MKAMLNKDGVMTVIAETELEAFALSTWSDAVQIKSDKIMFDTTLESIPHRGRRGGKRHN